MLYFVGKYNSLPAYIYQWRIPDFPLGGPPSHGGGHRPLTRVLFSKNTCKNKRIGSIGGWGACAGGAPLGSANELLQYYYQSITVTQFTHHVICSFLTILALCVKLPSVLSRMSEPAADSSIDFILHGARYRIFHKLWAVIQTLVVSPDGKTLMTIF